MNPTASGVWSQSGELVVGNPSGAVVMQVGFPQGGTYTVSFNVQPQSNPAAIPTIRQFLNPEATVVFSAEGNIVQRRLSLVNGTSISGPCDHVDVRVVDNTSFVPAPADSLRYIVTVMVAPRTRPTAIQPYLRGASGVVLVPGTSSAVAIPPDSGVIAAMVSASGGIATVQQRTVDLTVLAEYPVGSPRFDPLVPESENLLLQNDAGAPSNATFSVLFGVDG